MSLINHVPADGRTVSDEIAGMQTLAGFGLTVHPERCVRLRNRHASCSRCADACTSGAISFADGVWRMSPEKCVGCGTCATVCPTCALESRNPNDAVLLHAAKASAKANGGTALFMCHTAVEEAKTAGQHVDLSRVAEVVCLSRLEETLIFTLLAGGVAHICAIHGSCEACPRKQGCVSRTLVAETVATIAEAWGMEADYRVVGELPPEESVPIVTGEEAIDEAHREVLSHVLAGGECVTLAPEGHVEASYNPVHVQKDGTLPHFVPERRRRLLDALATFGDPVAEMLDTRLWGHVIIDFAKCRSCKMCAVFCPTGAISKYTDEHGIAGIEHYVAECVHCRLCQDICPGHAITSVTAVPALQLAHGETERYPMPDPVWHAGPDQILQRMRTQIGGNSVAHSY